MTDKETSEIKEKLTIEEVLEYYKRPVTSSATHFIPIGTDRIHHTKHSHVVFTVFDPDELTFALIKRGPLSEAEQEVCLLLFCPVRKVARAAAITFIGIVRAVELSNNRNEFSVVDPRRGWLDLSGPVSYLPEKLKNSGPFTKEEYMQLSLRVAKDAKDGGWIYSKCINTINEYSLAGNGLVASLDLSEDE